MSKFTQRLVDERPTKPIAYREMTIADHLTDVGWLDEGEGKERMKVIFMIKHGQYFDNGVRVKNHEHADTGSRQVDPGSVRGVSPAAP